MFGLLNPLAWKYHSHLRSQPIGWEEPYATAFLQGGCSSSHSDLKGTPEPPPHPPPAAYPGIARAPEAFAGHPEPWLYYVVI